MARQKAKLEKPLRYALADDGMGVLERAALAGLYLTLEGAEEWAKDNDSDTGEHARRLKGLFHPWDLSHAAELTLDWVGEDPIPPLRTLVEWAWQVRDGVFFLPGVHRTLAERNNWYLRVPGHSGILGTFLQHGNTPPKIKPSEDENNSILVDEDKRIEIPSFPVILDSYKGKPNLPPQHDLVEKIVCGKNKDLSGTYYPGIAPRFRPDKGWTGPPKQALLLLFAPLACLFLDLPRNRITLRQGKRQSSPNWAVVIPDIVDLHGYASVWPQLHPCLQERFDKIRCKSVEDAALRVAAEYATTQVRGAARRLGVDPTLYVFCMGRTSYQRKANSLSNIQMIRKQLVHIQPRPIVLRRYQILMAHMDNRRIPLETGKGEKKSNASHYIRALSGRGRIAANLAAGKAWYTDLLIPTDWERDILEWERERYNESHEDKISSQRLSLEHLGRKPEKEALMALTKDHAMYDNPETETLFVHIIHDMMATLFWKEREALKSRSALKEDATEFKEKLEKRYENLVDDLHRSLTQAQTRELLRQTLIGWLAKGGPHQAIREHRKQIWNLVNHPYDWKKARDLALLSLITYAPRSE